METAEILLQFERATGELPRPAIEAAMEHREEITPELLRILADTIDRATQLQEDRDYMAHLYAMYLLAQFRETRAYPLILRFASLPGDLLDSLCGDFISDGLGPVLASVCGGDIRGIQSLIENEDANKWARWAGMTALVTLVAAGQKSRDEVVSYFASLFRGRLVREWSYAWDGLVSSSYALYPEELFADIKQAYEEDLVDSSHISLKDVERQLAVGKDASLTRLSEDYRFVENTIDEMESWACFQQDFWKLAKSTAKVPVERAEPRVAAAGPSPAKANPSPPPIIPQVRTGPKIGRNDPCPCGSGKKYKKCCGA
jgi:Protein of unknown function (DUF1186)/SEC-C motif